MSYMYVFLKYRWMLRNQSHSLSLEITFVNMHTCDGIVAYKYVVEYGWPSYSQFIIFTSSKNIFNSSKNIFTGSRNKTLAKATHN